jgi:hypothetical protein
MVAWWQNSHEYKSLYALKLCLPDIEKTKEYGVAEVFAMYVVEVWNTL